MINLDSYIQIYKDKDWILYKNNELIKIIHINCYEYYLTLNSYIHKRHTICKICKTPIPKYFKILLPLMT